MRTQSRYDGLRAALPDAAIAVHVTLPERRSCDFVVGGVVWVEVLGLSIAAMAKTTSQYQRDYAEHWAAKAKLYTRLGIVPVLVEPADLVDVARLRGKLDEIAARLGTPCASVPLTVQHRRANGTWTFEYLCQVVAEVADEVGGFPTHAALTARDYATGAMMLREKGMAARVATSIGATLRTLGLTCPK